MTSQNEGTDTPTEFTPGLLSDMLKKIQQGETTATQLENMLDKIEAQMASIIEEMGEPGATISGSSLDVETCEDELETEKTPE
ncbi:hypothetical protein ACO0RG_000196 [Hanseniaspora osmophila]|uniref:Uncharacterized protein n=1 Tax=Hanseniaspora osmophila TaxID=56408 RepID=A0A1E5R582_9ASCO|nr:hypothetical protein AWRI3579_g3677 [Hanseniaspora osmophila]